MVPIDELSSIAKTFRGLAFSAALSDDTAQTRSCIETCTTDFFQRVPVTTETSDIHQALTKLYETALNQLVAPRVLRQEIEKTIFLIEAYLSIHATDQASPDRNPDLAKQCKRLLPSYRIAQRSKLRTLQFHKYLEAKPLPVRPESLPEDLPGPIEEIQRDCALGSGWLEWARKRPRPMHSSAFLETLHSKAFPVENRLTNLEKHINVYFYLTPVTRKSAGVTTAVLASKPMSKAFRARIQCILEEIAASFSLERSQMQRFLSESDKIEKIVPAAAEVHSLLLETVNAVRRQHYEAKICDEVHFQPFGSTTRRAEPRETTGPDFSEDAFVFFLPSCIRTFVEWLRPGKLALFMLNWLLLCALKHEKRDNRPNHAELFPKSLLKASKAWASAAAFSLLSLRSQPASTDDPHIAVLTESLPLLTQLIACAAGFIEAEKLSLTIANMRELGVAGVARRGPHDALALLELHETKYSDSAVDKLHSRHSTRTSADSSLDFYAGMPASYSAENFSPALLRAIEAKKALHRMEAALEERESVSTIESPSTVTTKVLFGVQATLGDPMQAPGMLESLQKAHTVAGCLVRVTDIDYRNKWLDTRYRARRQEKDDVPWDAIVGQEESETYEAFYNRVDRCGYAGIALRLESGSSAGK